MSQQTEMILHHSSGGMCFLGHLNVVSLQKGEKQPYARQKERQGTHQNP